MLWKWLTGQSFIFQKQHSFKIGTLVTKSIWKKNAELRISYTKSPWAVLFWNSAWEKTAPVKEPGTKWILPIIINFLLLLEVNYKLSDGVPEGTWIQVQNCLPSKLKEKGKTELPSFCLQTAFYLPTDCLQIYNSVGYLLALYKCMYFCCWFTDVFDKALCKGTICSDNFWRRIIISIHSSLQEIFCGGDNGQA